MNGCWSFAGCARGLAAPLQAEKRRRLRQRQSAAAAKVRERPFYFVGTLVFLAVAS